MQQERFIDNPREILFMHLRHFVLTAIAAVVSSSAMAGTATVHLNGGDYIQSGSVVNTSAPHVDIVKVVYDLGTQVVGAAIWERYASTGTHSNVLDGNWYSTETWAGLSVAGGNTFQFSGLDINLIQSLTPPAIDISGLGAGPSLANATVSVYFSDNSWGRAQLTPQYWGLNQDLQIAAVPEPETYALMLAGLGLLGAAARRKQRKAA